MWSEIYGDASELEGPLVAAIEAAGWIAGPGGTPHRLTLRERTRGTVASFELDVEPSLLTEGLRERARHVGYRRHDWLEEWRDGVQTLRLAGGHNGMYRGQSWSHVLRASPPLLPADLLAMLRAYRADELAPALLDHLHGPAVATGGVQVFHHRHVAVDDPLLATFFDTCVAIAATTGELELPGVAHFFGNDAGVVAARPARDLVDWANGDHLDVDLSPVAARLPSFNLDAVAVHLMRALPRRTVGYDLLFSPGVALHVHTRPPTEHTNPRTGETFSSPGDIIPRSSSAPNRADDAVRRDREGAAPTRPRRCAGR